MSEHVRAALAAVVEGKKLSMEEAHGAMGAVMDGQATASQLAALLVALRMRGETVAELAGFAPFGDSPDVRWAWIAVTAFRGHLLAQEGNADEAIEVLREVLPVIDAIAPLETGGGSIDDRMQPVSRPRARWTRPISSDWYEAR